MVYFISVSSLESYFGIPLSSQESIIVLRYICKPRSQSQCLRDKSTSPQSKSLCCNWSLWHLLDPVPGSSSTRLVDEPQGRHAIDPFPNNNINMMPAILCHKGSDEPTQAFLWLAGDIDNHSLATTQPYDTCRWVNIRLSIDANERLNTEDWPLQGIHVELKDESDKDLVALGGLHTLVEMGTVEDRFQL